MPDITEEIRRATCCLRFKGDRVDVGGWGRITEKLGHSSAWALAWIMLGYVTPPDWILNANKVAETPARRRWRLPWPRRNEEENA